MRRTLSLRACAASSRDKVMAAFLTGRLSKMCTGTRFIKYLSTFPNFTQEKGAAGGTGKYFFMFLTDPNTNKKFCL
jgi:hypothetical protein